MSDDVLQGLEGARRRLEEMKRRRQEHKHSAEQSPSLHSPSLSSGEPFLRRSSSSSEDVVVSMLKQEVASLKAIIAAHEATIMQHQKTLKDNAETIATLKADNAELRLSKMDLDEKVMHLEEQLATGAKALDSGNIPSIEKAIEHTATPGIVAEEQVLPIEIDGTENLSTIEITDGSGFPQHDTESQAPVEKAEEVALSSAVNVKHVDLLDDLEETDFLPESEDESELNLHTPEEQSDKVKSISTNGAHLKLDQGEAVDEIPTQQEENARDQEVPQETSAQEELPAADKLEFPKEQKLTEDSTKDDNVDSQKAQREKMLELFMDDALLDDLLDDDLLDSDDLEEEIQEVAPEIPSSEKEIEHQDIKTEEINTENDPSVSATENKSEDLLAPDDFTATDLDLSTLETEANAAHKPMTTNAQEHNVEENVVEDPYQDLISSSKTVSESAIFLEDEQLLNEEFVAQAESAQEGGEAQEPEIQNINNHANEVELIDLNDTLDEEYAAKEYAAEFKNTAEEGNQIAGYEIDLNDDISAETNFEDLESAVFNGSQPVEDLEGGVDVAPKEELPNSEFLNPFTSKGLQITTPPETQPTTDNASTDMAADSEFLKSLESAVSVNTEFPTTESETVTGSETDALESDFLKSLASKEPLKPDVTEASESHKFETHTAGEATESEFLNSLISEEPHPKPELVAESDFLKSLETEEPIVNAEHSSEHPFAYPIDTLGQHGYHGGDDSGYSPYDGNQAYQDSHYYADPKDHHHTAEVVPDLEQAELQTDTNKEDVAVASPESETIETNPETIQSETQEDDQKEQVFNTATSESLVDESSVKADSIREVLDSDFMGGEPKQEDMQQEQEITTQKTSTSAITTPASTPASTPMLPQLQNMPVSSPVLSPPPPIRSPERAVRPPITVNEYLPVGSVEIPKTSDFRDNLKRWQGWQVNMVNWNIASTRVSL